MARYNIVRFYQNAGKRVIRSDVSLDEAKNHCADPQTSSKTAAGRDAYTRRVGPWFDGFEEVPVKIRQRRRRRAYNPKGWIF